MSFAQYLATAYMHILELLWEHIELTAMAVAISVLIGVPLGVLISYQKKLRQPVLGLANLMQAVPSMALLGFAIPFFGIGKVPAIIVVIIYSLLPILKNTYTGISQINPQTREAAIGIGLSRRQLLTKVEIPLALPIIMAGVRISAVTAVGLMTIAAFIGAGGLGDLVFAGIRTVDNNQILAGAIPACLLALLVDYLLGQVELLTTPISNSLNQKTDRTIVFKKRRYAKIVLGFFAGLLIVGSAIAGYQSYRHHHADIRVGSKNFTEGIILGHMMSDLIENRTGLKVDRRMSLGGTQVAHEALKKGDIDLYLDYSGTTYVSILKHEPSTDMDTVYQVGKQEMMERYGLLVLPQYAFNNTYALAVTPEIAEKYHLKKISDLRNVANQLHIGTTFEFQNRPDGLPSMMQHYGLHFADITGIDDAPRYVALINNEIQITDAFATDGLIKKFNLVLLEDDQHYFPPYYATPVLRNDAAQAHPEIIPVLVEVGPYLTDNVMQELNYQVDEEQQDPAQVAHRFLQEKGLLH